MFSEASPPTHSLPLRSEQERTRPWWLTPSMAESVKPYEDKIGRTYVIFHFAPAVIVIRFKTLNNNKNQLLA